MLIRLALADDLSKVEQIVEAAYSPYIARIGKPPGPMLDDYASLIANEQVYVLANRDGIAGIIVVIPETDAMLLDNVAVAPTAQGQGYGKQLISFAEATARRQGFDQIKLYTHELMSENLAIYASLGFLETHRVTEKGYNRVYMSKQLSHLVA